MLSPLDLENKRIVTRKRKYDKAEMDEYIALVMENYKALYDENQELHKQVKTLSDGVQYYRSMESTMQKALVLAEKTSKETKDAAILKAEAIEKDATVKAEQIISEAEQKYETLKEKCFALIQQFNNYKSQLTQVATEQLELVTSESFEVNSPEFESFQNEDALIENEIVENVVENVEENVVEQEISASYLEPSNADLSFESDTPSVSSFVFGEDITEENELEKTMVIPNLQQEDVFLSKKEKKTDEETISILTADTIDLSDSIQKIKEEEMKSQMIEPIEPISANVKNVQEAKVVTPIEPIYVAPTTSNVTKTEVLEPVKNQGKDAPTLDSLLQSMNMSSKKNNKKGQDEDPFEFLGSVDDF